MGKASPAIAAFNAGEWSPQMEGRVDNEKYAIAAHIQQNFIPLKQGASMFRAGSAYVQPVKNSATQTWLRRFEFSQTQAFVLEFGDGYVRFYSNHGPELATGIAAYNGGTAYVLGNLALSGGIIYYCIAPTTGNAPPNASFWYPLTPYNGSATTAIYEVPSPYAGADLTDALGEFALQIEQSGDVLYIAGGSAGAGYPPYTLTRFANNPPNWQFASFFPTDGPFSDAAPVLPNGNTALTVSAVQGNAITINAWGGTPFLPTDVGRLVRIGSQYFNVTPWATQVAITAGATNVNNGNNYVALTSATTGASPPVHTAGAASDGGVLWLYTDSGYGVAQITVFVNTSTVTANVIKRFPANVVGGSFAITGISQANPCVVTSANAAQAGVTIFITGVGGMTQVNGNPYVNQTQSVSTITLAGIDSTGFSAYTSGGTAVLNGSIEWQMGAWSNTTEWPRALAFYKDRLFWAGKLNVWGSVPGLYTSHTPDFFGQQTTDSAMNELVSGADASNVCWLSSAIILLIGTEGGEYGLDSANYSASPLGPANVEILRQSAWRCRHIRPELVGTSVLYVQRSGRKVFAMDYNFYLNRYDSTDQSKFAYHISIGGLTSIAYQQEPWSLLWATRADGTLLSYTFNREDNVTAWARHNLGGNGIVESIAVIPAPDTLRDEVWMVVNRTLNGAVVRTVEYFAKHFEGPQGGNPGDVQASAWYVDCGVQYAGPPDMTIVGVTAVFGLHATNVTFVGGNSFSAGQTVYVSGVVSAGTLDVNKAWVVLNSNGSQFTASQPGFGVGSFSYESGGAATAHSPDGTTTITGIPSVFWGQTVAVLADGGVQPQQVVSNTGTIVLPGTFSTVTLGFPYQGNLVPVRPEGGADVGTAQGKIKEGANLVLRLVDAGGGVVGQLSNQNAMTQLYQDPLGLTSQSIATPETIRYNDTTTALDSPPPIQSGDFPVSFPHSAASDQDARDFYILVQQNDPLPMTVAGLFPSYKVEDPQ